MEPADNPEAVDAYQIREGAGRDLLGIHFQHGLGIRIHSRRLLRGAKTPMVG
jgi:hypothetical protein